MKMKNLMAGLVLLITACTPTEKIVEKFSNRQNDGRVVEASDSMDSEQLALAGEQLVSLWNFMLAQRAFDWSLQKDPNNERAQFYSAILKPFMLTKGLATRLRPYMNNNGGTDGLDNNLKNLPNSALKTFLLDGREDIKDSTDMQNLLVQVRDAWNDMRKFLIVHQNTNLVLNMNPNTFQDSVSENMRNSCHVEEDSDNHFIVKCDYEHVFEKKVNAADLIALRQMASGHVLFLSLYTAYSVDGIDQLTELERQSGKLSEREKIEYIQNVLPNAAKLRKDNSLSVISDLGSDFLSAGRWVVQYQRQLCPRTPHMPIKRPGYLFDGETFCIADMNKTQRDLVTLEASLHGPINIILGAKDGRQKSAKVDAFQWFRAPVQDLRAIAPASYNNCDRAQTLKDKTLGGFFVNGDAEDFMIEKCWK
jgi:hypothetical protein